MTPQRPKTASPKKRKDSLQGPSSGSVQKKKQRRSDGHEGPATSSAEKLKKKVKKQHEAKKDNKGKEPIEDHEGEESDEEDDFNVVDNTLENQKILIENGHHGPKRKKNPNKVSGSVRTSIDSWFTDTPWSQVKPSGKETEEELLKTLFEDEETEGNAAGVEKGAAEMGDGNTAGVEKGAAEGEGDADGEVEVTPQKKKKIYDTGGKGRKPCGGGCGKFVPAVSKYETCVTDGKPVSTVENPPVAPKIYDNGGKGRKPCKGGCGKFIACVAKNDTCVSTGEAITASDVAQVAHAFSKFPGSVEGDIGKAINGTKSIVSSKKGVRTGQTLVVPVYDEMDEFSKVKNKVATLEIGNLVDSKKEAYAMTYTLDGSSFVKTVLADELEKFAEDSDVYEMYGHVTSWVGRLEGENIVLLEEMSDPIVNPYWTDISLFFPKETQDIGGLEVEDVNKADSIFKFNIGGWKKDEDEFNVALSGRIFAFGEDDGVDLNMIIYTPIMMIMSYDVFCEKMKKYQPLCFLMSLVANNAFVKNPEKLKMFRYSIMENGWVVGERLKEYLMNVLKNAD